MNDLRISVIIPVYKAEKYLRRCIDSVLSQNHQNLEVFLIDDGSPDESGAICDEYAVSDSRVVTIHTPNQGAYAARNLALDRATGDYIGFVDADDWLEPDMYQVLMSLALEYNADVAQCEMSNEGSLQQHRSVFLGECRVYNCTELPAAFFREEVTHGLLNKVFRRSCWENLRFPAQCYHEDAMMMAQLYRFCKTFARTDRALYHYNTTNPSITRGRKKPLHVRSMERLFAVFDEVAPCAFPISSFFLCSEISCFGRMIPPSKEIPVREALRHVRVMHEIFVRHWERAKSTDNYRNAPKAKQLLWNIYNHFPVVATILVSTYGQGRSRKRVHNDKPNLGKT